MMNLKRHLLLLLVLFGSAQSLFAQSPTLPFITNFTPKEYEAHPQNLMIRQNHQGLIFVANVDGVLEYDGHEWKRKRLARNNPAFSLDLGSDHQVYVGGVGEFGRLVTDSVGSSVYELLSDQLPDSLKEFGNVWHTVALDDIIYFNADNVIFSYHDGEVKAIQPQSSVYSILKVENEAWAFQQAKGLFRLDQEKLEKLPGSEAFINFRLTAAFEIGKNKYLAVTRDNGLYSYEPESSDTTAITRIGGELSDRLSAARVYGAIRLKNGSYALHTLSDGVFILSPNLKLLRHISRGEGLQNETVLSIHEDERGLLWCGTDNGISFIELNNPLSIRREGDQFSGAIQCITRHDGNLYLGTIQGAFRIHFGRVEDEDQFERLGLSGACMAFINADGDLLSASDHITLISKEGLTTISDQQSRTFCQRTDLSMPLVVAGGAGGISVLQKEAGKWLEKIRLNDLPSEVYSLQPANEGIIRGDSLLFWVSTWSAGVHLLAVDPLLTGAKLYAMNDSAYGLSERLTYIYRYRGSNLFCHGSNTYRYDQRDGKFIMDTTTFPAALQYLFRLTESADGGAWISTGQQLVGYQPGADGGKVDSTSFRALDIGGVYAIYEDYEGAVWLGGDDALVKYDPALERPQTMGFRTLIRRVTTDTDSLLFGGSMPDSLFLPDLKYRNNSLVFHFSAPVFQQADRVTYAWQLEGYDNDYVSWRKENKAIYTNLPAGDYTFKVKARNLFGEESTVASFKFRIQPPWYQRWWAFLTYALVAFLLFYGGIRINARRLQAEKERLEGLVSERTAELEQKNEAILQQKALVEEKNKDITDSILYASKIQSAILTSDDYLKSVFNEYFVLYLPKSILSGDFYWAFADKTEAGEISRVIYAAADCTGHGVPGALMSMLGSAFLNEIVVEHGERNPDKILNALRLQIIKAMDQRGEFGEAQDGMDIALCVVDIQEQKVDFAGAHNPLIVIRKGELIETKADSQPVGYYTGKLNPFTTKTIDLQKGDMLYTFSDGYADQFGGPEGKKYKMSNFRKLLLEISELPLELQKQRLEQQFNDWKGELEQIDDVCVMAVRF